MDEGDKTVNGVNDVMDVPGSVYAPVGANENAVKHSSYVGDGSENTRASERGILKGDTSVEGR